MGGAFRDLAGSKKFIVFFVSVVIVVGGRLGFDLDPEVVEKVVALAVAYLIGQGIADFGKGRGDAEERR